MSGSKLVKVDNWGIYFLQKLKHFFNRTDYCDLTLQFQDNAQLKVHRLVLNACTEYFELLERTCEMYEECLVMPDDLQADVVVPIVNFLYTGQLEFTPDMFDKLLQTSEIMNLPVLTKLLYTHRPEKVKPKHAYGSSPTKRVHIPKQFEPKKEVITSITPTEVITTTPIANKRSYSKAFEKTTVYRDKKVYLPLNKLPATLSGRYREPSPIPLDERFNKKVVAGDPRPTRYELPEELDTYNVFENSFSNISYTSQPLMIHPETRKQYSKRPRTEASISKKNISSTVDIVQCNKSSQAQDDNLFEDSERVIVETEMFQPPFVNVRVECRKDPNQLFDQILVQDEEEDSKVSIETKNKSSANLDHAKIISEVLKKYPHLVKSNKNIKLKILNPPSKNIKKPKSSPMQDSEKKVKSEKSNKVDTPDFTYETDVLDSKQAAKLIAMGAENIDGPWICLICGTPGKAINFTSYYKFRRHLVDVHKEKPVLSICEYCGQRSAKRNYLVYHLYTKHGVVPPPQFNFPKCPSCNYIALSEALLMKHKVSHTENKNFRCYVCPSAFNSSKQLLTHIQNTGHKYSAEKKTNLQCIYCQKVFLRESNLYAHLKAYHKVEARKDGIIDDSDDEQREAVEKNLSVRSEPSTSDFEELDIQYQIHHKPDGNIHVVTKKPITEATASKQKILNPSYTSTVQKKKCKITKNNASPQTEAYVQNMNVPAVIDNHEEIVMIDNNEYIIRDNQLIPQPAKSITEEYILSDDGLQAVTSSAFPNIQTSNSQENIEQSSIILNNSANIAQSIPIYVSNEGLMTSNQHVIFDNNDSNKTLTVLTAPHTSHLENTSININNTQPSDMMIIQDGFPLNVSQAVATENSNIVVVYSHELGDQNKQYQLLTTAQGLEGAQFIQNPSILAQNFSTVTTSTSAINAQVLDKQVEGVWHNNLDQVNDNNQLEITSVNKSATEIQSIVEGNKQPAQNLSNITVDAHQVDSEPPVTVQQAELEHPVVDQPVELDHPVPVHQIEMDAPVAVPQVGLDPPVAVPQVDLEPEVAVQQVDLETPDVVQQVELESPVAVQQIELVLPVADHQAELEPSESIHQEELETPFVVHQEELETSVIVHQGVLEIPVTHQEKLETSVIVHQAELVTAAAFDQVDKEPSVIEHINIDDRDTSTEGLANNTFNGNSESNISHLPDNNSSSMTVNEKVPAETITIKTVDVPMHIEHASENVKLLEATTSVSEDLEVSCQSYENSQEDLPLNLSGEGELSETNDEINSEEESLPEPILSDDENTDRKHKSFSKIIQEVSVIKNRNMEHDTEPSELEESIENIQDEVRKQMSISVSVEHQGDTIKTYSPPRISNQEEVTHVNHVAVSSLLNDWNDNDSQDGSGDEDIPSVPEEVVETTSIQEEVVETTSLPEEVETTSVPEEEVETTATDLEKVVETIGEEVVETTSIGEVIETTFIGEEVVETTCIGEEVVETSSLVPEEIVESTSSNSTVTTEANAIEQDNIKKLVSDWDDEEEDIRE